VRDPAITSACGRNQAGDDFAVPRDDDLFALLDNIEQLAELIFGVERPHNAHHRAFQTSLSQSNTVPRRCGVNDEPL
jgi:hypothetical protein